MTTSLSAQIHPDFKLRKTLDYKFPTIVIKSTDTNQRPIFPIYFDRKYEYITHVGVHFVIGLYRVDYSLISVIAIEGADTINGRFEWEDWTSRLSGTILSFIVKKYIFKGD